MLLASFTSGLMGNPGRQVGTPLRSTRKKPSKSLWRWVRRRCRSVKTRHCVWTWKDGHPVQQIGLSMEHAGRLARECQLNTLHPVSRRGRTARDLIRTWGPGINWNAMSSAAYGIMLANAFPAETDRTPETLKKTGKVTRLRDPQCYTLGIRRGDPRDGRRTSRWKTSKWWKWRQLLSSLSFSERCRLSRCAREFTARRNHHSDNYSRFPQIIIVDTGSNISLIHLIVCSSEARATSISHFGVTYDKLEIKGVQPVELHLNDTNYRYKFCVCSILTEAMGLSIRIFFGNECQIKFRKGRA